ncbi:hypothetical protein [Clostridium estertheticum]|uniref:hypothetical protein n=1 Tax=Clostridium estertheticum TaxID=238834 RepID=UPI001C7D86BD|nr:hypothetical protein [Clostridium estertheticum]MBX4269378.1 hypothetical protein [Clostridium estertheticum]WLC79278.1 hypothetical protein KTC98_19180 [Clostridium estertheticum]
MLQTDVSFNGLVQVFMLVCTGLLTYKLTFPDNFSIGGQALDFSSFTLFSVVMIVIYFILGYFLYAMMNAVAFIALISIKIYSAAILHYGKRLKLKDLMKISNTNKK